VTWSNGADDISDGMGSEWSATGARSVAHWGRAVATWDAGSLTLESSVFRYDHTGALADLTVNGTTRASAALLTQINPTGALRLGAYSAAGLGASDVDILEFWVWNRRLTNAEVAELSAYAYIRYGWMNPFPYLVDYSTGNHQGTMTNMESTDIVTDTPGTPSKHSVDFGGTDEYVNHGNVCDFHSVDPFSVSVWTKNTSAAGYWVAKMVGTPTGLGWGFQQQANGKPKMILCTTNFTHQLGVRTTNAVVNDGAWHHVVMTQLDGTAAGIKFYIDGVEILAKTTDSNWPGAVEDVSNAANLNIGSRSDGAGCFTGMLDEVAIYNKVLSLAEVQAIYALGHPPNLTELATGPNSVLYDKMGD
jgi:hypothetical protein